MLNTIISPNNRRKLSHRRSARHLADRRQATIGVGQSARGRSGAISPNRTIGETAVARSRERERVDSARSRSQLRREGSDFAQHGRIAEQSEKTFPPQFRSLSGRPKAGNDWSRSVCSRTLRCRVDQPDNRGNRRRPTGTLRQSHGLSPRPAAESQPHFIWALPSGSQERVPRPAVSARPCQNCPFFYEVSK